MSAKLDVSVDRQYTEPDPNAHSAYQREIYSAFRAPVFSTKPDEWERQAKLVVPAANYGYVFGSAGMGKTYLGSCSDHLCARDTVRPLMPWLLDV